MTSKRTEIVEESKATDVTEVTEDADREETQPQQPQQPQPQPQPQRSSKPDYQARLDQIRERLHRASAENRRDALASTKRKDGTVHKKHTASNNGSTSAMTIEEAERKQTERELKRRRGEMHADGGEQKFVLGYRVNAERIRAESRNSTGDDGDGKGTKSDKGDRGL
ncbi:hypothetical protein GQ42DRAFT_161740 [Ramicandelaber brevisporus]|nr:hypothetical protein GQ42DRAFT_161740 [Ramicandelaber brevisporus]